MEITSINNPKVKAWVKLQEKKYRDQTQSFLVAGEHLIQEAQQAGCLTALIVLQGVQPKPFGSVPVYEVTRAILRKLTSLTSLEDQIGVCRMPKWENSDSDRLIILDGIQDPGNMGTIIRSAISFGYQQILLSKTCVDIYNEKVIRATQGALFHMPMHRCSLKEALPKLKAEGLTVFATALRDSQPLQSIQPPQRFALVFGNEGNGISSDVLSLCDRTVKIEMNTFESLNVAVAAGICMYYFYQHA